MAACVLGAEVGLRLPTRIADSARHSGRARAFTPWGRPAMREWIVLGLPADRLPEAADLVPDAPVFALAKTEA